MIPDIIRAENIEIISYENESGTELIFAFFLQSFCMYEIRQQNSIKVPV
jgi:hypothetical protein